MDIGRLMKKRIGLIAMSGVRAHNEELTKLGLTLPGFVERNQVIASLPSLGLLTLAGLTPDRFDVEYHEIADLEKLPTLPTHFDLVAISTFTAQLSEAYRVADHFKSHNVPVVMGGITASALAEEVAPHCTSVVIGEGEPLWPVVLRDLERGQLNPFYAQTPPGQFDLGDAPPPRFSLLNPEKYNRITVQTSRGCPHRCEFCASSILLTPRYKLKPVEKVLAEIHAVQQIWDHPFIEFADDNTFVHRDHSKRLMRALIPEQLQWFTETDIRVGEDDELLGLIRDAGCRQLLIGLESPHAGSLRGIELRSDFKARQRDRYFENIQRIQAKGITVNGCFVLGLDEDTPDVFDEVLAFVRESGLYEVQVTFMTPFPGTPLYERLQREGRLLKERAWEHCTLFDMTVQPRRMSVQQLQQGFLRLVRTLYSAEETSMRRRNFYRRLRRSKRAARPRPEPLSTPVAA